MISNRDLLERANTLFRERFEANARRTDRLFACLMVGQWLFAIVLAVWVSPYTWAGKTHVIHVHVYLAVFLGAFISSLPIALAIVRPGWFGTRVVIAVGQMLWSGLLIHLGGGRIETHFHVFGSLAFIAFYRDWRVLVPATLVVAADHAIRQFVWPESIFGVSNPESWRFLEHAGWVLFEDLFLVIACIGGSKEMKEMARQQIAIEIHEREAAAKMQTSILPRDLEVDGLEAAAHMHTADTVGGDYYDVWPVDDGCWIAIGDVAGHGVQAGLTMMQVQSAFAALVGHHPQASPAALWTTLNNTYITNVRHRLQQDDHMTLSLLRYHLDGAVEMVGAHEEVIIWRSKTRQCESIPVRGTWMGMANKSPRALELAVEETRFSLETGDLLVLYTDGVIEARDAGGGRVGIQRLRETITSAHAWPVSEIRDAIFALSGMARDDDASVMVFRYVGVQSRADAA